VFKISDNFEGLVLLIQ